LYIDVSKTFACDTITISHTILLPKLRKYGIRGTPLAWFRSYLPNQEQYMMSVVGESDKLIGNFLSATGINTRPIIILLYIN
jgi:hypothetical protein